MEAIRISLHAFRGAAKTRRFCVFFCAHWPEVSARSPTKEWSIHLHPKLHFDFFERREIRCGTRFARN